jgi:hypothetical protein
LRVNLGRLLRLRHLLPVLGLFLIVDAMIAEMQYPVIETLPYTPRSFPFLLRYLVAAALFAMWWWVERGKRDLDDNDETDSKRS